MSVTLIEHGSSLTNVERQTKASSNVVDHHHYYYVQKGHTS